MPMRPAHSFLRSRRATVLAFALLATPAAAGEDTIACPWVATAELDRILVDGAPWVAGEVARDSCRFAGERAGRRVVLTLERRLHAAPDEAKAQAATLRHDLEGALAARAEPDLGEAGFSGHARIIGGELVRAAGHRGAVFAQAIVGDPSGTTEAQRGAMLALADRVLGEGRLSLADEPPCPWLTPQLARQLLPGGELSHPDDETCELRTSDARLVVEAEVHASADDLVQYLHDPACRHEPVSELGGHARVVWACPDLPGLSLIHAEGDRVLTYTLSGSSDITPALHRQLVTVAVAMRDARAR